MLFTLLEAFIILLSKSYLLLTFRGFCCFIFVCFAAKKMDSSYSFALGTSSSILPKLSFRNVENRFYGEKNNNNGLCKRFGSDLGSKKFRNQKFKHGVVYAVATSDNPKKAMVC